LVKRIFILGGVVLAGTALVCGLYIAVLEFTQNNAAVQPGEAGSLSWSPENIAIYDVDAMASRMPSDKDYYAKVRDDGLAFYSSHHPKPAPYDERARAAIRLGAYYMTWGDFYGENVLLDLVSFEETAEHAGCSDRMLCNLDTDAWDDNHFPDTDALEVKLCNDMLSAEVSQSPAAFRLWGEQTAIISTLNYNDKKQTLQLKTPSMQLLPKAISRWEQSLAELIKDKAPAHVIYSLPYHLLDNCKCDEATMGLVIAAIDQAYNEAGVDSGLRVALDGDYFIDLAWAARGSGYANTVSDRQAAVCTERLQKAQQILEEAFSKYPNEPAISTEMLSVAIGNSLDGDTMETWFQRALQADPNNFLAYANKALYLQPRWYGTVDGEVNFVRTCVDTQNWTFRIPMVLASALDMVADNGDSDLFARTEVWTFVEPVYRKYLELHPRSTRYRTFFLRAAYLGHHRDVVSEQYKLLGQDWDTSILSDDEYRAIAASVGR
jgi:tetratricopeptide (TPR) repeat protein